MHSWSSEEFVERLRQVGHERYHDKHPFHRLMHAGKLSREQIQCWVANRFYYQKNIPVKDAVLLSRCPLPEVRRLWVRRIIDHDGAGDEPGGIDHWLRLGEAIGLARSDLQQDRWLLPGARYSVDAYVNFVATRPWIEGVASSLTELFAPKLMTERLSALSQHYSWIDSDALIYFRSRPALASRDSGDGLDLVTRYCTTIDQQQRAVDALRFKCDVLWALLDAIYYDCVVDLKGTHL